MDAVEEDTADSGDTFVSAEIAQQLLNLLSWRFCCWIYFNWFLPDLGAQVTYSYFFVILARLNLQNFLGQVRFKSVGHHNPATCWYFWWFCWFCLRCLLGHRYAQVESLVGCYTWRIGLGCGYLVCWLNLEHFHLQPSQLSHQSKLAPWCSLAFTGSQILYFISNFLYFMHFAL